jgi:hypothetical protein
MRKPKTPPPCEIVFADDGELYVVYDGRRIAKRAKGRRWISLEPGYTVFWNPHNPADDLVVEYKPVATH